MKTITKPSLKELLKDVLQEVKIPGQQIQEEEMVSRQNGKCVA